MKYFFTIFLSFGVVYSNIAQHKHDYNWLFGYLYFDDDSSEGAQLSFGAPLEISNPKIPFWIYHSNAMMSNQEGDLIFYTNGCSIANANHEIMENGDGLNPGEVFDEQCNHPLLGNTGYPGSHQSNLILPVPSNDNFFYLIHESAFWHPEYNFTVNKLYLTTIDLSQNDNQGKVINKNITLMDELIHGGNMTAIKKSDENAWWLINRLFESDQFFSFLVRSDTIEGPFFQGIGLPTKDEAGGSGTSIFTPDGTKFIQYDKIDNLQIFDFDRSTGQFSNFQQVMVSDTLFVGSCAVSPNSRFLYVSNPAFLWQFDLQADDIEASKVLIDTYDGFADPFPHNFLRMQLTPDCRIFMNSTSAVNTLHIIHNPNKKGLDCNFEQRGIQLPTIHQTSMPHFPYYRMDTDYPICDSSLIITSTELFRPLRQQVSIFPNPTHGPIHIHLPILPDQPMRIAVFNAFGQVVWSAERRTGDAEQQVDLSGLAAGVYVVQVDMGSAGRVTEKVVMR